MNVDMGSETSKLHAKRNSVSMSFIDSLSPEMRKALAIAVGTTVAKAVVEETWKSGKMIFNILKRKADDEADDEADGLQNNYEKLMKLERRLSSIMGDISDKRKTKLITRECEDWISGVKLRKGEVERLKNRYKRQRSLKNRYKRQRSCTSLSERMADECSKLDNQIENAPDTGILAGKLPDLVIKMHGPKLADKPFLLPIVEKLLCYLRDENMTRIGLFGDPKTGKTTIMQSLNNNGDAAKMFDIIIWVSASKDLDFGKLQHIIAGRLKLNVEGITDPNEIFHKICLELKGKRYLLLLDEASESFDPSWIRCYENEEDSKVVLTAISRRVCLHMHTDDEIEVELMSRAVAWEVFKEKVGRNVNLPLFRPIAERVANACHGSPQVIDKVASKFRKRDGVRMWEEGLRILQGWPGIDIDYIDKLL